MHVFKEGQEPKVGQYVDGSNWMIAKIYLWPDYWDLELVDAETGERGDLRVMK